MPTTFTSMAFNAPDVVVVINVRYSPISAPKDLASPAAKITSSSSCAKTSSPRWWPSSICTLKPDSFCSFSGITARPMNTTDLSPLEMSPMKPMRGMAKRTSSSVWRIWIKLSASLKPYCNGVSSSFSRASGKKICKWPYSLRIELSLNPQNVNLMKPPAKMSATFPKTMIMAVIAERRLLRAMFLIASFKNLVFNVQSSHHESESLGLPCPRCADRGSKR